jgi:hypothetical protein
MLELACAASLCITYRSQLKSHVRTNTEDIRKAWRGPCTTVVGTNLCVLRPLEVKDNGIRGVGGVAGKEACCVHATNFISRRQYLVACCFSSYVGNIFGLHSI